MFVVVVLFVVVVVVVVVVFVVVVFVDNGQLVPVEFQNVVHTKYAVLVTLTPDARKDFFPS